jgi:hypothetical protein
VFSSSDRIQIETRRLPAHIVYQLEVYQPWFDNLVFQVT